MIIDGKRFLSKCCMAEPVRENDVYVCSHCEKPADLIESSTPQKDESREGVEYEY